MSLNSTKKIAVLKGDGIGPEVTTEAIKVLDKVAYCFGLTFEYEEGLIGGCAYDAVDDPLPEQTIDICKASDGVLLGAVGGSKWDNLPGDKRPETGLLRIRKELKLYANIRPAVLFPSLVAACPLAPSIASRGIDIAVVRELTGGIYFGEKGRRQTDDGIEAYDIAKYSELEIRRIAVVAFNLAMKRGKNVISIDKANVLESCKLWREVVAEVAKDYPEVSVRNMLVDNAAMQLVKDPSQFDVVLADNMFGDILSDEAAMITGSIGILPSSSMGDGTLGLYEPIHGSAPDIAGKNIANPIAAVLSAAMMLRYSFGYEDAATSIENAVNTVLESGYRTADLDSSNPISCSDMGDRIRDAVSR